ncbi:protein kinase [Pseudoduganella plicata]|nr:serine/threonine-protein kinase [Pseudoduganella plicata]GGZ01989.1 hypothetical protein GCM10007388_39670 [Pseudoduganella plicata]
MTAFDDVDDCSAPIRLVPANVLPQHYHLRKCIGEGGHGRVFEAWDSKLCRTVAVKCVRLGREGPPGTDLLSEARAVASLEHDAFVQVHAIEENEGNQAIVMELVHGATLKATLAAGPVDPVLALDWVRQVAEAMGEAHATGLVHGDLKPSNLMLETPRNRIRILDFGIAVRQDPLATGTVPTTSPQGTIAYMAPERLLGTAPTPAGDVYGLGVVLYELVTGVRPFADLAGLALVAAHLQSSSATWRYPDTLAPAVVELIRAMTEREPAARVRSMDEVLARLEGFVAAPRRAVHKARPVRWRAAAAVVIVAAAAGAWYVEAPRFWRDRGTEQYSETAQIDAGLAALALFDRPGALDQAATHFQRVLRQNPQSAAAAAGTSLTYSLRYAGDRQDEIWLRKADASAQQALKLDDHLALAHAAHGWVLGALGQTDGAGDAFGRALRLDPDNFLAWYGKVYTLRRAGRYPQAHTALAEALRRFPRERVFTDELGSVYYEQAENARAEAAFRRSIALQPDAVTAYANLNAVLLRQDRPDEALHVLQQGLQVRPSAKLYGNLGTALFLRGDYVGAAQALENAVSPTRGAPGDYLNWANLADVLLWIPGREQEARAAYGKARELLAPRLQRAPHDVVLVSRMGLYAARTGDAEAAMAMMARALALGPRNADVNFRAGLAYELLGHRVQALAAIANARRLGYPVKFIEAEPDLVALRRDPGYESR